MFPDAPATKGDVNDIAQATMGEIGGSKRIGVPIGTKGGSVQN